MSLRVCLIGLSLVLSLPSLTLAQESSEGEAGEENEFVGRSRLALVPGLTYIPGGEPIPEGGANSASSSDEAEGERVIQLGIDWLYKLSERWGIGIGADYQFGEYLIVEENLTRRNVFIISALLHYEVLPRWEVYLGPGYELEQDESFLIWRFGTEYEFGIGKDWLLAPNLLVDVKEGYNSYLLALAIGRWL